ncbi:DUF2304 domain-containing protein [Firmicutes bacterium i23-0019-B6]
MNVRIQIIVAIGLVLALCVIINMIRKKALELRYALAWLLVGFGTLILDLFPGVMMELAKFMGIEVPSNMLFFLGFCFALIIIFVLTIAVSRMSIRIKNLTQEMALYKKYMQEKENNNKNNESR